MVVAFMLLGTLVLVFSQRIDRYLSIYIAQCTPLATTASTTKMLFDIDGLARCQHNSYVCT